MISSMEGVCHDFVSRTKSPARNDAVQFFVASQGCFVLDTRALVVSRAQENTSSLPFYGKTGTGLQILAGSLFGKKIRSRKSVDGPFKNYLKSFLRKAAVSPGNAFAPRNPVKVADAKPIFGFARISKKRYKREAIFGQVLCSGSSNHKPVDSDVISTGVAAPSISLLY